MATGIQFDRRKIEKLGIGDQRVLTALQDAGIQTIGDLQRHLVRDERIYQIGPRRLDYLRDKLHAMGLIAERPWTDRFYEKVYGRSNKYHTLSVEGERVLVERLTEWLHDENNVPHSDARADPLFIFCGRIGCGRIQRRHPGNFDNYGVYELKPSSYSKRFNDRVLSSGQIARICGAEIEEVNRIYQRCLSFLRGEKIQAEVWRIFDEYGERRK